jgi:hypothetical protein
MLTTVVSIITLLTNAATTVHTNIPTIALSVVLKIKLKNNNNN